MASEFENTDSEGIDGVDVAVQRRHIDGAGRRVPNVGTANRFEDAGSSLHVASQRTDGVRRRDVPNEAVPGDESVGRLDTNDATAGRR